MSHLLFPILSILSDGKFHSGEAMAKHFKVSRVAIWHAIAEAENLGVEVFSVRGKGYRLTRSLDLIDEEKINTQLETKYDIRFQYKKKETYDVIGARLIII